MKKPRIFGPATVSVSGTLLDSFGFTIKGIGDVVSAEYSDEFSDIRLVEIKNNPGLPLGPENVVEAVAKKLYEAIPNDRKKENKGIKLVLEKNMKIGTGMGSSASSGVAAAVAINDLHGRPFTHKSPELLQAVVYGEYIACGAAHPCNAIPCLVGGPIFILSSKNLTFRKIKTPPFHLALISPDIIVTTREARRLLWESPYDIPLLIKRTQELLEQNINRQPPFQITDESLKGVPETQEGIPIVKEYLKGALEVMYGFINNDAELVGRGLDRDKIVTKVRLTLIKGYEDVKCAAKASGASAVCISGSGPAIFTLNKNEKTAIAVGNAMQEAFQKNGVTSRIYISEISSEGAHQLET